MLVENVMNESMKELAGGFAEKYIKARDRAWNDLIVGCCDGITMRLETAIDDGVTGDDFSEMARGLVDDAAEAIEQCDGGRVGKDVCDILPCIFGRLSDSAIYHGAVRVDVERQRVEFVGEENPLGAVVS